MVAPKNATWAPLTCTFFAHCAKSMEVRGIVPGVDALTCTPARSKAETKWAFPIVAAIWLER